MGGSDGGGGGGCERSSEAGFFGSGAGALGASEALGEPPLRAVKLDMTGVVV
jgi:hypothetical protein